MNSKIFQIKTTASFENVRLERKRLACVERESANRTHFIACRRLASETLALQSLFFAMPKTILICVVGLVLILLAGESVFACTCSNPPTVEQSFEQSAAVFYGAVESVETSGKDVVAQIRVEKSWKGASHDLVTVKTEQTSCGIDFKPGEKHYLFVDRDGENYKTVMCRRHAGTQEEFLRGKSLLTIRKVPRSFIGGGNLLMTSILVFLGFLAVFAAAVFILKRRKAVK